VCDEDSRHIVGMNSSVNPRVAILRNRNLLPSGSLHTTLFGSIAEGKQMPKLNSLASCRNSGTLKPQNSELKETTLPSLFFTSNLNTKSKIRPQAVIDSEQTIPGVETSQGKISTKKSVLVWKPNLRPIFSLPKSLIGDSGIEIKDLSVIDPTSATYETQGISKRIVTEPCKLVNLGRSSLESKIYSHRREIKGPGTRKFMAPLHIRQRLTSVDPETVQSAGIVAATEEALAPLRQLHPRIQTVVVGETPSAIEPIRLQMTGNFREKSDTVSSRPIITVRHTLSISNALLPNSSAVGSQGDASALSKNSRISQNPFLGSANFKEFLPKNGSGVFNHTSTSKISRDPGASRERLPSEVGMSSPSKDSNPFLRSIPNFDEVVLSPTNKLPLGLETSALRVPDQDIKLQLDSNEDIQGILQKNSPFMNYIDKQEEAIEKVKSYVRQQSKKQFAEGLGKFIGCGLGLKEEE
jgi:hypothetical protein